VRGQSLAIRRREEQARVGRLLAEREQAQANERRERQVAAARQREQRDRDTRARAHELSERLGEARRLAEETDADFEHECSKLAAGTTTMAAVESRQFERDAARRKLEIWSKAVGDVQADGALAGRR
jgi:hypothetical protein